MYDRVLQSTIIPKDTFYIDKFGNHSPPDAIIAGGNMRVRKLAFLLPLDYNY